MDGVSDVAATARLILMFVAASPILAMLQFGPLSGIGLLTLVVSLATAIDVVSSGKPTPVPIGPIMMIIWVGAVSLGRGTTFDEYSIQQAVCLILLATGFMIGCREASTPLAVDRLTSLILTSAVVLVVLDLSGLLASRIGLVDYPYSPVLGGLLAAFAAGFASENRARWVVVLAFVGVVLNQNRTVSVLLVIVIASAFFARRGGRLKYAWLPGAGIGGGFVVTSILYPNVFPAFTSRWLGGDNGIEVGGISLNTSGRSNIWGSLVQQGSVTQPFGAGPGAASRAVLSRFSPLDQPHNDYLRLWFDYGAIGSTIAAFSVLGLLYCVVFRIRTGGPFTSLRTGAIALSFTVLGVMLTLNPLTVAPAMAVLGLVAGIAFGATRLTDRQTTQLP